jgi:hypothetical protein
MSRAFFSILLVALGLVVSPSVANANVDCPSGLEFGPSLRLLQSDGWTVTVATAGRTIGGSAVAIPPNQGALWRGSGEGGSDGQTVAFGVGFDNGTVLHYTGIIDQTTGAVTGERPDGITWKSTSNMRCIGAADTPATANTPGAGIAPGDPNAPGAPGAPGTPEAPAA